MFSAGESRSGEVMLHRSFTVGASLAAGLFLTAQTASPAAAQEATADPEARVQVTDLGTMRHPAAAAVDLNNAHRVIGNAFDPETGRSKPAGWLRTDSLGLGYEAHENGRMLQINDKNLATGTLDSAPGVTHAVFWNRRGHRQVLRPDATFSAAVDLNDYGKVLLWYSLPDETAGGTTEYASLWHQGQETAVLPLRTSTAGIDPSLRLRPVALNNNGQVALTAESGTDEGTPVAAYHWADGRLTDLGSLGGGGTSAAGIDQNGRIAGTTLDEAGRERAFVWEDGEMHDLGTLGGETSTVAPDHRAMSDTGHVIGLSEDADGGSRAFIWSHGEMRDLGTLGGADPQPTAVNDRGEVVGHDVTAEGQQHAFFWDGQEMVDLGTLGGEMSRAYALNDRGQVAGISLTDGGADHAALWTVE